MQIKISKQMITGKAFEFALLLEFKEKLSKFTPVKVLSDSSYSVASQCFEKGTKTEKGKKLLYASFAVNFLMDIEPRLKNGIDEKDILELQIASDSAGETGDVRDVLIIRNVQKWEIGISAKNNHHAVKHSRLSNHIDFGEQWIGIKCSSKYFDIINPIFANLAHLRKNSKAKKTWKSLGNYHKTVYLPILEAFVEELKRIYKIDPEKTARNLVEYLIGNKDYYKEIKSSGKLEIQAFNLHGTLNRAFKSIRPKIETPRIKLPTKIVKIEFKDDSDTTIIVTLDQGWILSFRIHNASSRIEPSLKFDINLISSS